MSNKLAKPCFFSITATLIWSPKKLAVTTALRTHTNFTWSIGTWQTLSGIANNTEFLYYDLLLDEGAANSAAKVNQWLAYHFKYHLHPRFKINPLQFTTRDRYRWWHSEKTSFWTAVNNMPLSIETFFDYWSTMIPKNLSMILSLQSQMRFSAATRKDVTNPYAEM